MVNTTNQVFLKPRKEPSQFLKPETTAVSQGWKPGGCEVDPPSFSEVPQESASPPLPAQTELLVSAFAVKCFVCFPFAGEGGGR